MANTDRNKNRTRNLALMTAAGTVGILLFPWLSAGGVAAAGVMTAVSAIKDHRNTNPDNDTTES